MNPIPLENIEPPPLPESMPPIDNAFYFRVETPIGYPPQAAAKLHQTVSRLEKDILMALGYSFAKRLRTSRLVFKASKLRIDQDRLPSRGLYEIVENMYKEGTQDEDEKRRKTVKTQRNRLRQRLVKRYEKPEQDNN
jgi:hypothetical protein